MKKKISVVYSVDYETEIEVDTELEEGSYIIDEERASLHWDSKMVLKKHFKLSDKQINDVVGKIEALLENELSGIEIWEGENTIYRENSFIIKSIQV